MFFGPRFGYGGGCLGSIVGAVFTVIILVVISVVLLFAGISSAISAVANGGVITYNEEKFQDYADAQYAKEFGSTKNYENNLLIVLATNEDTDGYYAIAWVGDNIKSNISNLFGDETTAFGLTVNTNINQKTYKYSLSNNLASVMETMQSEVKWAAKGESVFRSEKTADVYDSHVTDYTSLVRNQEVVNDALKDFTAATGIPAVIVVDTTESVFGKTFPVAAIIMILLALAIITLIVYLIVKAVQNKRNGGNNGGFSGGNSGGFNGNNGGQTTGNTSYTAFNENSGSFRSY